MTAVVFDRNDLNHFFGNNFEENVIRKTMKVYPLERGSMVRKSVSAKADDLDAT